MILDPIVLLGEGRCVITGPMGHTQGRLRVNLLTVGNFIVVFLVSVHLVVALVALNGGVQRSRAQKLLLQKLLMGMGMLWHELARRLYMSTHLLFTNDLLIILIIASSLLLRR